MRMKLPRLLLCTCNTTLLNHRPTGMPGPVGMRCKSQPAAAVCDESSPLFELVVGCVCGYLKGRSESVTGRDGFAISTLPQIIALRQLALAQSRALDRPANRQSAFAAASIRARATRTRGMRDFVEGESRQKGARFTDYGNLIFGLTYSFRDS